MKLKKLWKNFKIVNNKIVKVLQTSLEKFPRSIEEILKKFARNFEKMKKNLNKFLKS